MTATKRNLPKIFSSTARSSVSQRLMLVGLVISLFFLVIALFGSVFQSWGWLQNPSESLSNPIHEPPSLSHFFGTSQQGYDVFSSTLR